MPAYVNNYTAPSVDIPRDCHLTTPLEEYDHNYMFEVKELKSDRVEMRPFIPSLHAQLLYDGLAANPEISRWLSLPPVSELNDILTVVERVFRRNADSLLYAIFTGPTDAQAAPIDPSQYTFAGCMALISSSSQHLQIEPGWIMILKPFQRTHVLTHAAGLVMHRILDMPAQGGLGCRRCQWTTTTLNTASQNAAKRLGYTHEGVLRAQWVLPPGKEGVRPGRKGDAHENGMQRDNWFASVTFEDWEGGVREHVDKLMARRS